MTDKTVDFNHAECIQETIHFGYYRFHNVCQETTMEVYWGLGDWLLATGLSFVMVVGLSLITLFISLFIRDVLL